MVQNYYKIINNVTDKNPEALRNWKTALEKLHYAVRKAIESNIKVPTKQAE
ncbi:MAG TPA: hypothetical protein P5239_03835 [Victivallales bacterium]|nr:hypothetical protein [Victivallales bacterium]